jgi:hypothetical protein
MIHDVMIADHVVALNGRDGRPLNVVYGVPDVPQVMRIVAAESVSRKAAAVECEPPEFEI